MQETKVQLIQVKKGSPFFSPKQIDKTMHYSTMQTGHYITTLHTYILLLTREMYKILCLSKLDGARGFFSQILHTPFISGRIPGEERIHFMAVVVVVHCMAVSWVR